MGLFTAALNEAKKWYESVQRQNGNNTVQSNNTQNRNRTVGKTGSNAAGSQEKEKSSWEIFLEKQREQEQNRPEATVDTIGEKTGMTQMPVNLTSLSPKDLAEMQKAGSAGQKSVANQQATMGAWGGVTSEKEKQNLSGGGGSHSFEVQKEEEKPKTSLFSGWNDFLNRIGGAADESRERAVTGITTGIDAARDYIRANQTAKRTGEGWDDIGRFGQGNIDLYNRPTVKNEDGSISTVNSISFQDDDGKEVLIPTIVNGKLVTEDEAINHYYETGEYLGKFNTRDEADAYAERLHNQQNVLYAPEGTNFFDPKRKRNDQNTPYRYTELADDQKPGWMGGVKGIYEHLTGKEDGDWKKLQNAVKGTSVNTITENSMLRRDKQFEGAFDNDPNATPDMLSIEENRKRAEKLGKESERLENERTELEDYSYLGIPQGSANSTPEGVGDAARWAVEGGMIYNEDGSQSFYDQKPEGYGTNADATEKANQDMFRTVYGPAALNIELANNGGRLSAEYEKQMGRLWDKIGKDSYDYSFTQKITEKEKGEYESAADAVESYRNQMEKAATFSAAHPEYSTKFNSEMDRMDPFYSLKGNDPYVLYSFLNKGMVYNAASLSADVSGGGYDPAAELFEYVGFIDPETELPFFNMYMNAGMPDEAMEFLKGMKDAGDFTTRHNAWMDENAARMATETPISAGASTVLTNLEGTVMTGLGSAAALLGNESAKNPNSFWYERSNWTNKIRTNEQENLTSTVTKMTGSEEAGQAAGTVLGWFFSAMDNLASRSIGLGIGRAAMPGGTPQEIANIGMHGSMGIMTANAYSNSFKQHLEETRDPGYSAVMAGVESAIEWFTENLPGTEEEIFDTTKRGLRYVLDSFVAEGKEGAVGAIMTDPVRNLVTKIMNDVTGSNYEDVFVQQAMDRVQANPDRYRKEDGTYNYGLAMGETLKDYVKGIGEDFINEGGATLFSAVPFGLQLQSGNRQTGRTIRQNNPESVSVIADMLATNSDPEMAEFGKRIQSQLEKGKKVSNTDIGIAYNTLLQDNNEQIRNTTGRVLEQNVRSFLSDTYGENMDSRTKDRVAEIIRKAVTDGEKLSRSETEFISRYPAAMDLMKDMTANQGGEYVDPMKRSAGTIENIEAETKTETADMLERMKKLGEMTESAMQKTLKSVAEYVNQNAAKAKISVKGVAEKLANPDEVKNILGRIRENAQKMIAENRANAGTEEAQTENAAAEPDADTMRKTVIYGTENGDKTGGTIVGVEGNQYVIETEDGQKTKANFSEVQAADEVTAAAMNYIEVSGMDQGSATDLLDVIKDKKVTAANVESLLENFRDVKVRGYLGMSFPEKIGFDPSVARKIYQKGQASAITDEETRVSKTQSGSTLNPGNGKVEYRGVNVEELDDTTRKQVEATAAIAKKVGYNLIFENDTKNKNRFGEYDATTNSVILNLAGTEQSGNRHHLMVVMSHEVTHLLENKSPEAYKQLRDFVFRELGRNGMNIAARIGQKMDNYNYQIAQMRENGEDISDISIGGAVAEVVADACDQVLGNEELIRKLSDENPNLFRRVKNIVNDFVNKVIDAAHGMRESGSRDSLYIKDAKELAKKWGIALEEARKANITSPVISEETDTEEVNIQLSVDENDEIPHIKDQIRAHENELNKMDPVGYYSTEIDLTPYYKGEKGTKLSASKAWAREVAETFGEIVNDDFGTLKVSGNAADKIIKYLKDKVRSDNVYLAAFQAIPKVINKGFRIGKHNNHKGRNFKSFTYGAPVVIDGERGNMGVTVITPKEGNSLKTIRVLTPNGKEFEITINKKRAEEAFGQTTPDSSDEIGRSASASNESIQHEKQNNNIQSGQNQNNQQTQKSLAELDDQYMAAANSGDNETAQKLTDQAAAAAGYNVHAYHGTSRGDRVGNVFLPERATSGPMAFFTDNRNIAENYAKDKKDTSIEYDDEYGDYFKQFRGTNKSGKSVPIGDLWNEMSYKQRQQITEAGKHITEDDDGNIIYDPAAKNGNGGFDSYRLRDNNGNAINALIDVWLQDGNLYGEEGRFLDILRMAGIEDATWNNPDAVSEKVYDTYLKINNPFNTGNMYNEDFLKQLEQWYDRQDKSKYKKEAANALDIWDKNRRPLEAWIEEAREMDMKEGTTHMWTSIPDAVTDFLKEEGYDGIQDTGGKNGGASHTVWIPFSSEQVKSAEPVTYDDQGKVIPLSERFNPEKTDIRYSLAETDEIQQKQNDLNETRKKVKEIENSQEFKDAMDTAMAGDFEPYNAILERTKLADLKRKVSSLEKEIEKWKKDWTDQQNRNGIEKERAAIEKSGLTEDKYRNRQAVKEFGRTTDSREAGYIILDGGMLNFSGEKGTHRGRRGADHRSIGSIYEDYDIQGNRAMTTFMNDGNIRVMYEAKGIDLSNVKEPTAEQYRTIRKLANEWKGDEEFNIDFSDETGKHIGSINYEGRIYADRVVEDIRHFYQTGEIREPSEVSRFYSLAEEGPRASDWIMALDANDLDMSTKSERQMVRSYQKTRNEIDEIEKKIAGMKDALKEAKGDEARKLRINLQTENNKLTRANNRLNELTGGKDFEYMLRRAQESIDYLIGLKSQEEVDKAADRMRAKAEEMRRTAKAAGESLEKIAAREEETVRNRYIDQTGLRKAAAGLNEYFGLKDQQRMEDGLAEIGMKMAAGDESFTESLDRMARRILEDMYGTGAMIDSLVDEDTGLYNEHLSDITAQIMMATQEILPGMAAAAGNSTETENLTAYIRQLSSMTQQAARGMQTIAQMAEALKTQSDETKAATANLRRKLATAIRYYDSLNQQRDATASADAMEETIRKIESNAAKQILEAQNKWANALENDRNLRRLSNENLSYRHRINTAYRRMAKLILEESDLKNVPAHMQPVARAAIRMILENDSDDLKKKLTGVDRKTLKQSNHTLGLIDQRDGKQLDIQAIMEATGGDDDVGIAIENALADIERGIQFYNSGHGRTASILEGDKSALQAISRGLSQIYDIVTASQKVFVEGKAVDTANMAYEVDAEAKKKEAYKEFVGGLGKVLKGLHRNVVLGNMTPEYFIKNLKNNGLSLIYNEFKDGEDKYGRILMEAKQKIAKAAEKAGYSGWDMETKHEIQLTGGKKISLTLGQLMSLEATWKRENTLGPEMSQHLTQGGFVVEEESEKKVFGREAKQQKPVRLTAEDMAIIEKELTQEQKTYVDDMVQILSKDMGRYGNEASMRMFGIEKYKESYYFPFQVWSGVKNKSSDTGGAVNPTNNNRAAHQSFTNRRKNNAGNAVMIRDFNTVCAEHINQMATYATFGGAIEGMNRVLNYRVLEDTEDGVVSATERNVEAILTERYGENAVKYLRQFMADLNGGAMQQNSGFGQSLMSMFKKNAVGGSLSVALQQPLSYIRASTMIETKYLAAALNPTYYKGSYQEMLQHSGVAVIKDMGKFDMNFARGAAEWLAPETLVTSRARRTYNAVEDATNALPEKMDQMTWTRMWSAIKIEQHAAHPNMDMKSDEFLDMVGKRFNEVMRRTQVYDSVLVKSQLMRNQSWLAKSITAFRAEPTLSLNLFMDAIQNAKEKGGKKNAAAVAATFLLSAIAQAVVKGIMSAGRTPDEKKTLAENFAYRFANSMVSEADPLSLIPGMDNIIDGLSGNNINDNAWGMITTFGKSLQKIWNPPTGENLTMDSGYRYIEDTVGQIAQMFTGVPAKNLMRDSRAVYNWFMGSYADRDKKDKEGNIIPGRATSGSVLKYQAIEQATSAGLLSAIQKVTGISLWDSRTTAYTDRIYQAEKEGNTELAEELREYLMAGKGKTEKDINSSVASATKKDESLSVTERAEFLLDSGYADKTTWITQQYKAGELTEQEVRDLYATYFPDKDPNGTFWNEKKAAFEAGEITEKEAMNAYRQYHPKASEKDVQRYFWNDWKDKYAAGSISRQEAEKKYREYYPGATKDDIWSTFDIIDYEKETGKQASGAYYRLHDAIENNSSAEIGKAVKLLTEHGKKKNGFKSSIEQKWKEQYKAMRNGSAEKVRLRDGITKAMRAVGYSDKEIDKMFNSWNK